MSEFVVDLQFVLRYVFESVVFVIFGSVGLEDVGFAVDKFDPENVPCSFIEALDWTCKLIGGRDGSR